MTVNNIQLVTKPVATVGIQLTSSNFDEVMEFLNAQSFTYSKTKDELGKVTFFIARDEYVNAMLGDWLVRDAKPGTAPADITVYSESTLNQKYERKEA